MKGQWESEPRGFCKIDAEALTAALIAPGHGRTGVAELALHVAFFDFGRRSHSGAQRMPGKIVLPVGFGKIAAQTSGKPVRRSGYTLTILRKERDGRWRLARDANLLTAEE